MFNSESESKFVAARLEDFSLTTHGDGSTSVELQIGVGGNDEDLIKQSINKMTSRAKEIGADYEVTDTKNQRSNSKSFVSNWGSGSAWKHAKDN